MLSNLAEPLHSERKSKKASSQNFKSLAFKNKEMVQLFAFQKVWKILLSGGCVIAVRNNTFIDSK